MSVPVVVLDNGAGNVKVGFAGEEAPRKVFPHCTVKVKGERQGFLGDQLVDAKDISSLQLRRPFDRGYLINWDMEKDIWNRAFHHVLRINPEDCAILLTEPLFNLPSIRAATDQMLFEEFGFQAVHRCPSAELVMRHHARSHPEIGANRAGCGVVVDAGFSFTHAVPLLDFQVQHQAVRRLNLGGKLMTNYMTELISYRSINMMEETYIVDLIKDTMCFVSQDLKRDMADSKGKKSKLRGEYVLPDGVHNLKGFCRYPNQEPAPDDEPGAAARGADAVLQDGNGQAAGAPAAGAAADRGASQVPAEQVVSLANERFVVPEVLFHPMDLGMEQAGLPELVSQACAASHPAIEGILTSNIVLAGGCVACPGLAQRFTRDVRPLLKDEFALHVTTADTPALAAWKGGSLLASSPVFPQLAVTKRQYEEQGSTGRH